MAQEFPVGPVETFTTGKFVVTTVNDTEIGIVRLASDEFRAVRNWCPHKGAPICRGIVGGTWPPSPPGELAYDRAGKVLVCPWHGFEYDLDTGRELFQAVPTRLRLYPVSVRDNHVYVTV
jgi:nitrite reductase/ring-hydroxylating ferredoxin subunit